MDFQSQDRKLAALKAKTDGQLAKLILHELDLALLVLDAARQDGPGEPISRAEKAYTNAVLLIPTLGGLTDGQERRLHQKVQELGARLETASAHPGWWTLTAGR